MQGVDPLYDVDIDDIVHNIDIDYVPDFLYLSIWCKQIDIDMISIYYCQYQHSRNYENAPNRRWALQWWNDIDTISFIYRRKS